MGRNTISAAGIALVDDVSGRADASVIHNRINEAKRNLPRWRTSFLPVDTAQIGSIGTGDTRHDEPRS